MIQRIWFALLCLAMPLATPLAAQQSPAGPVIPTTGEFDPMREPRFAPAAQAG